MGEYAEERLAYHHPEVFGNGHRRRSSGARTRVGQYLPGIQQKGSSMSDINSKNYDGASAVIVGRAGGPVEIKTFDKGASQAQLSVAVGKGYKNKTTNEWVDQGTDWYTLTATEDYANQNWPEVNKGDKVRIDDARLELKGFVKNNGEAGVEATLRYGTLVIVEAKSARAASASAEDQPF